MFFVFFFFFDDTATTEIYTLLYTLSLHDALPISRSCLPGTCLVPEAPTPPAIPNLTPFFATHHRSPSGPSATYGMRSLRCAGAWDVKRSGGDRKSTRLELQSHSNISYA